MLAEGILKRLRSRAARITVLIIELYIIYTQHLNWIHVRV